MGRDMQLITSFKDLITQICKLLEKYSLLTHTHIYTLFYLGG